MALLMARKTDNTLIREAILGVLSLDSFQFKWGYVLFLTIGWLMSVLSTPVADKFLVDMTPMVSHVPTMTLTAHPSVISHLVSTYQRV